MSILAERRFWIAFIPALVMISGMFGLAVTEDMLTDVLDKVLVAVMSALSLWSLLRPKPVADAIVKPPDVVVVAKETSTEPERLAINPAPPKSK